LKEILRTQIHIIRKNHYLYKYCDDMTFKSKNLYNRANYIVRENFIKDNLFVSSYDLNKILKYEECFTNLPTKTSQQIIIQLGNNWRSFFRAVKDWSKNKDKYEGQPSLPKFKPKNGRNIVFFDYQQGRFKNGKFYFPMTGNHKQYSLYIETTIQKKDFRLLKIRPYGNCYKIEIVYRKQIEENEEYNDNYLAIDLGINNLTTLTNNIGLRPIVINGRILKSVNNYYNKLQAEAMSYIDRGSSNRFQKIVTKRNNIFDTHLHRISRTIINYCLDNNIENIVIGRNKDWQRCSKMGKKNNQRFVQIPYEDLIQKILYKAEEVGIRVAVIEEQYTSKSSFIDNDFIPEKFGNYEFSGKRICRGLYKSGNGSIINADVNGSFNILRKCNPEFYYDDRIKDVSFHPIRFNI